MTYLFVKNFIMIIMILPSQVILCGVPGGSPAQSAVDDPPDPADATALTFIHCMCSSYLLITRSEGLNIFHS